MKKIRIKFTDGSVIINLHRSIIFIRDGKMEMCALYTCCSPVFAAARDSVVENVKCVLFSTQKSNGVKRLYYIYVGHSVSAADNINHNKLLLLLHLLLILFWTTINGVSSAVFVF